MLKPIIEALCLQSICVVIPSVPLLLVSLFILLTSMIVNAINSLPLGPRMVIITPKADVKDMINQILPNKILIEINQHNKALIKIKLKCNTLLFKESTVYQP